MIEREIQATIREAMHQFPAVGILGPRQIGKTTLALQIAQAISPEPIYLDLESPTDLDKLKEPEFEFHILLIIGKAVNNTEAPSISAGQNPPFIF